MAFSKACRSCGIYTGIMMIIVAAVIGFAAIRNQRANQLASATPSDAQGATWADGQSPPSGGVTVEDPDGFVPGGSPAPPSPVRQAGPSPATPVPGAPPVPPQPGVPPVPTAPAPPEEVVDHMRWEMPWQIDLTAMDYPYGEVLGKSLMFFEAQRSGALSLAPGGNRIKWRKDQLLDDGSDISADLSGGHYEAGNRLKVTLAEGYFAGRLAMSCIYFRDVWDTVKFQGKSMTHWCKREVRFAAEYLMKTHLFAGTARPSKWGPKDEIVVMVGKVPDDFGCYRRASNMPAGPDCPAGARATLVGQASKQYGAADSAGEAAAALAGAAFLLYDDDAAWAQEAIKAAHAFHDHAIKYPVVPGSWSPQVAKTYPSSNAEQHQLWSAAMLAWVHGCDSTIYTDNTLCNQTLSDSFFAQADQLFSLPKNQARLDFIVANWDNPTFDAALLMAIMTPNGAVSKYGARLAHFVNQYVAADDVISATPKGLRRFPTEQWASLRMASFGAAVSLMYASLPDTPPDFVLKGRCLARSQLNYILGETTGMSYVVGVGTKFPQQVHHRDAACTHAEDTGLGACKTMFGKDRPNPHVIEGAIVGGPDTKDAFKDDRGDYHYTEVALDYNTGLTMGLAGMIGVDPDFWAMDCAPLVPNFPWKPAA